MKQIDITKMIEDNEIQLERSILGMEFIKVGDKFMIKGSNGIIVDEAERIKLENKELVIKDIESNQCQKETTKKISKNKKRLEEINENIEETEPIKE